MFAPRVLVGRTLRRCVLMPLALALALALPTLAGAATVSVEDDASSQRRMRVPVLAMTLADSSPTLAPPLAPPDVCAAAPTQAQMTQCAYDEFLEASSGYAASHAAFAKRLPASQRAKWLRTQSSWLKYRTAACDFESSAVEGGSLKPFVNWRCAARMTRERASEVARMLSCRQGDAACVRPLR